MAEGTEDTGGPRLRAGGPACGISGGSSVGLAEQEASRVPASRVVTEHLGGRSRHFLSWGGRGTGWG